MILADLNIICIGQSQKRFPPLKRKFSIGAYNRNKKNLHPVYLYDSFPVTHSLQGWWYQFHPKEWIEFLDNPFFEFNSGNIALVRLRAQWIGDIQELLSFYIEQSPTREIAVIVRLESTVSEYVHESCDINSFINDLIQGNVAYNHLYFIAG